MQNKGFTLIELLVTVAIIGIMASMSIAIYEEYRLRARISVAAQELINVRTAFYAFLIENDELPADTTAGVTPAGMASFLPAGMFSNPTPVGGQYNWDGLPAHNPPGISIQNPDYTNSQMLILDQLLDDGDFSTGQFRTTGDGHYKLIIAP